jgi:glycosyltransferase involved in cell wall biosynthesis
MANFSSVSIILPAINETVSLRKTVDIVSETCDAKDICEFFIVLCDKSTTECVQTAESIRDAASSIEVVIYYQRRPFIGSAIQEAFEQVRGSHVVMMSTDLETDPSIVAQFIEQEKKQPDGIVTASRWIKGGGFSGYSLLKYALNFIFQKLLGLLFSSSCRTIPTDLTYAYRIFPTDLVRSIRWEETKHPFFLETALKPLRLGIHFTEVPAKWKARVEGESQNSFFANFAYFKTEFHVRFMMKEDILRRIK